MTFEDFTNAIYRASKHLTDRAKRAALYGLEDMSGHEAKTPVVVVERGASVPIPTVASSPPTPAVAKKTIDEILREATIEGIVQNLTLEELIWLEDMVIFYVKQENSRTRETMRRLMRPFDRSH